ncbi:MAG: glycosyltransferase family 4 protein [Flavobacterium sp.]|uniref:glycosyltransferase family 4 protein n=1 Tax=Flavobacterium sp. TaxID=239 RepID=UPI003793C425
MRFVVISSAPIISKENQFFLYSPYEKEMRLWAKYVDSIQFCCPMWEEDKKLLIVPISFEIEKIIVLKEFDVLSFTNILIAIPNIVVDSIRIFKAMKKANHIHLRCPGNMALLASFIQILFPKKTKTAKYAGNWDPNAKQPFTYKLQRWILSNTFLTKNMQVLVYGDWKNQTKNIKPFFTATYSESEIQNSKIRIQNKNDNEIVKFLFVGTLSKGKQPLYAIQLVEQLSMRGNKVSLDLYGDGVMRSEIETYIKTKGLDSIICLKGNQTNETVLYAYQTSHFLILPSKSEGWPKVVAEAMFWGCVPIATPVSCVPYMVGNGSRGILLQEELSINFVVIEKLINDQEMFKKMSDEGLFWSQQFTTDKFKQEISKLLK